MSIMLLVNTKRAHFHVVDCGWYTGEEFSLLKIEFFTAWDSGNHIDGMTIFGIKVAKLSISVGFSLEDE